MRTKANTSVQSLSALPKNLSLVTIFGLFAVLLLSPSAQATIPIRKAINAREAQAIANQVLTQTEIHGVLTRDESTAHDREAHLCVEEPMCISKRMTKALSAAGFATKTVIVSPLRRSSGVRLLGPTGRPLDVSYDRYVVTTVRVIGGQKVIDPVALKTAQLVPFRDWRRRLMGAVDLSVR